MPESSKNASKIAVVIVAAGRGARAGSGGPKQYRYLTGKPVIRRTMETFIDAFDNGEQSSIILPVIHTDDSALYKDSVAGLPRISKPVMGGLTRQESVKNALEYLVNDPPEFVLIHDAARPFVSDDLINRITKQLLNVGGGVVPAIAVVDSLVRKSQSQDYDTVARDGLYVVQTPQAFQYNEILAAHRSAEHSNYTDDASILVANGGEVTFVEGSDQNFKITTAADFKRADRLIMNTYTDHRVGSGYDVHKFETGSSVWLGGIEIPFDKKLKGHSDADVALHALTDAVLSSIADGDIGTHFPPSDDRWLGASSDKFLAFACERVRKLEGLINMLAVTIICEGPKIGPHASAMRARIAEIAKVDVSRVSVQATTTEKLGFTGRGEGIAAQATATISLSHEGSKQ